MKGAHARTLALANIKSDVRITMIGAAVSLLVRQGRSMICGSREGGVRLRQTSANTQGHYIQIAWFVPVECACGRAGGRGREGNDVITNLP